MPGVLVEKEVAATKDSVGCTALHQAAADDQLATVKLRLLQKVL